MRTFTRAHLHEWATPTDPENPNREHYRDADDAALGAMLDGVNARNWHASGFAVVARMLARQMIPAPADTFATTVDTETGEHMTERVYAFNAVGDSMILDGFGRLETSYAAAGDGSVGVWTVGDVDNAGRPLTADLAAANIAATGHAHTAPAEATNEAGK